MSFAGDRVLIYMPLIPEAVMAMLATVRIGAIHSVVFGGKSYYSVLEFEIHAEQKTEIMFSKCCDTVSLQVQTTDRMKI